MSLSSLKGTKALSLGVDTMAWENPRPCFTWWHRGKIHSPSGRLCLALQKKSLPSYAAFTRLSWVDFFFPSFFLHSHNEIDNGELWGRWRSPCSQWMWDRWIFLQIPSLSASATCQVPSPPSLLKVLGKLVCEASLRFDRSDFSLLFLGWALRLWAPYLGSLCCMTGQL